MADDAPVMMANPTPGTPGSTGKQEVEELTLSQKDKSTMMEPANPFDAFLHVFNVLRRISFNAKELIDTALSIEQDLFVVPEEDVSVVPNGEAALKSVRPYFNGDKAHIRELFLKTGDPRRLTVLVDAANRLPNRRHLAEALEDALLIACLQQQQKSADDDLGDIKRDILTKLLTIFECQKLTERFNSVTRLLNKSICQWYLGKGAASQTFLSGSSSSSGPKKFKGFNIPLFDDYHRRVDLERQILDELKCLNPKTGVMAVVGESGNGRTTVVARVLTDPSTCQALLNECGLTTAIWLNCNQWRDRLDEIALERDLVRICRNADPTISTSMSNLPEIVAQLQTPLFILDDVYNVELIEWFRQKCPNTVCCIITREIYKVYLRDRSTLPSRLLGAIVTVPGYEDGEIVKVLTEGYKMSGKLKAEYLNELAKYCYHLPLLVGLIGPRFNLTRDACQAEYQRLSGELKEIDGKECSRENYQKVAINRLFQLSMDRLEDQSLRTMYYAFLLFDAGEPVKVVDLAILWGVEREKINQAVDHCIRYKKLALVRQLTIQNEKDGNKGLFLLHSDVYQVAVQYALSKSSNSAKNLDDLRVMISCGFCLQKAAQRESQDKPSDEDIIAIFYQLLRTQNRPLLERLVKILDGTRLLNICGLIIPGHMTFLHALLDLKWSDDVQGKQPVRHSFKVILTIFQTITRQERPSKIDPGLIGEVLRRKASSESKTYFLTRFLADGSKFRDNEDYLNLRSILLPWLPENMDELMATTENATAVIIKKVTLLSTLSNEGPIDFALINKLCDEDPEAVNNENPEDGRTPLSYAAERGDIELVKFLLEKCPEAAEKVCKDNRAPLSYAAEMGNLEIVQLLADQCLDAGDIPSQSDGRTPLSYAAEKGHSEIVQLLLEKYPKESTEVACKRYGRTPLTYATIHGHFEIVQLLLAKNVGAVKILCKEHGRTPLSYAAEFGYDNIFKSLVDYFSTIILKMQCEENGRTALSYAAERGHIGITKILLEKYPKAAEVLCTRYGRTPLSYACSNGNLEVVKMLADAYPDAVKIPCQDQGRTPLSYASERGHLEIFRLLIKRYPKAAEMAAKSSHRLPLSYAAERGHVEIVRTLQATYPKAVHMVCKEYGRTPLSYAAERGHFEVVNTLSENDDEAVKMASRDTGQTPLSYACENGHLDVVEALLAKFPKAAEIACKNLGRTPLIYACMKGNLEIANRLLETYQEAADIPCRELGRTPISYAAEHGHFEIVQALLDKSPKAAEALGRRLGRTPLSYAAENGHFDIVKLLARIFPKAVEMPCREYGRTPLSRAAERGHLEIVTTLLEIYPKAAEIPCKILVRTPLSYAASNGHFEIIRHLAAQFPDAAKIPCKVFERTPLSYAAEGGHLEVINLLIELNPKATELKCKRYGRTPLSYAAEQGSAEVVQILVDKYPQAANLPCIRWGRTPLSYAAERGHLTVVRCIAEKCPESAQIPCKRYGRTPLSYAAELGFLSIVKILVDKYPDAARLRCKWKSRTPLEWAHLGGHLDVANYLASWSVETLIVVPSPCKDNNQPNNSEDPALTARDIAITI